MPHISRKKIPYAISASLRSYLQKYGREISLPIEYKDLLRFDGQTILYDKYKNDTLWVSLHYPQSDLEHVYAGLKETYAIVMSHSDLSVMEHLYVDRIDLCLYGNTQPFRVRIRNRINDNYDYFYVKNADASRIFGLELEHLLSPNRINYKVFKNTLIEEHIAGIPGEEFIRNYIQKGRVENETRLAKEFVKFNERCFVRLLGDQHSSNFVIDITPDFEYYKQNQPIINIGIKHITAETSRQYQKEERSMIASRIRFSHEQLDDLFVAMKASVLSKPEYIQQLRTELAAFYEDEAFFRCRNMGEILERCITQLLE
jgi:hypothetical protein